MERMLVLGMLACSLVLNAAPPQDLRLAEIDDRLVRSEVAGLGGYPELGTREISTPLLEIPLRSWSTIHAEFASDDLRVRLERYPFHRAGDMRTSAGRRQLFGRPVIGWDPAADHQRLSRMEVVLDGMVCEVPVDQVVDVFDPRFCIGATDKPIRFVSAARSRDGWRVHVQILAGAGPEACLVTWVFEDGSYQYRVVDPFLR